MLSGSSKKIEISGRTYKHLSLCTRSSIYYEKLIIIERQGTAWSLCNHDPQAWRRKPIDIEDGRGHRKRTYFSYLRKTSSEFFVPFSSRILHNRPNRGFELNWLPTTHHAFEQQFIRAGTVSALRCLIGSVGTGIEEFTISLYAGPQRWLNFSLVTGAVGVTSEQWRG